VAKTVVQWNGQTIPTQIQTDANGNVTGVTATVAPALVAKPGTAFVNTLQPHSGAGTNGLSNPIAFIINPPGNPLPTVSSLSPTCVLAGSPAFSLTVAGSNLLPTSDPSGGSQVLWSAGGTVTTLTQVSGGSATQIQAMVPNTLLTNAGSVSVSVFNPPAPQAGTGNGGGGTSQTSLPFTVGAGACPAGSASPAAAVQTVAEPNPAVSADGRFVAFTATQGEHSQVFVRDTCQGATETCQPRTLLVSSTVEGAVGNDDSRSPSMSANGRYIAFSSAATNLFAQAPPGPQIYLRDTCFGVRIPCVASTQLVSTDAQGALAGTEAISPSISASGRFVTFVVVAPTKGANSRFRQVFVRDTCLATSNCTPTTVRKP
jgi:WD40-like Beta Propeller Repeat